MKDLLQKTFPFIKFYLEDGVFKCDVNYYTYSFEKYFDNTYSYTSCPKISSLKVMLNKFYTKEILKA